MPSIWKTWKNRWPPLDRNKVMWWARSQRVFIIDQQDDEKENFVDFKYGSKLNNAARTILQCYASDLRFPKPRSFSVAPWLDRGIFVTKIRGIQTFQQIRAMSILRERCVFHLWGHDAQDLEPAIEPNRGHLIVKCDYPYTSRFNKSFTKAKPFTTTCNFLNVSKEIWRL